MRWRWAVQLVLIVALCLAAQAARAEDFTAMLGSWRVTVPVPPAMAPSQSGYMAPGAFKAYSTTVLDPKTKKPVMQIVMGVNTMGSSDVPPDQPTVTAMFGAIFSAMGAPGLESKVTVSTDTLATGFTDYATNFSSGQRNDGMTQFMQANILVENGKHLGVMVTFSAVVSDAKLAPQALGFLQQLRAKEIAGVSAIPTER